MNKDGVWDNLQITVILCLMVVSALFLLGTIRSAAILGGALAIAFVVVSINLWMQFKELTMRQ
ncbi:hypothetical protein [Halosimplex pelagicum]|uniref:Uncharacterized protein n=1 Tax=Halosimplex pelagicum TaxID=869886 RepID=A0A7D5P927_9EURY|nr:hypothetical protein [Halosimplex pelagicum]QLH83837.1 hypothetical protein HZS54_20350 [Halosimplex pelagicum]